MIGFICGMFFKRSFILLVCQFQTSNVVLCCLILMQEDDCGEEAQHIMIPLEIIQWNDFFNNIELYLTSYIFNNNIKTIIESRVFKIN